MKCESSYFLFDNLMDFKSCRMGNSVLHIELQQRWIQTGLAHTLLKHYFFSGAMDVKLFYKV